MSNTKLSDSLKIRNFKIKNRICLPPMVCFCYNTSTDGLSSEKNVEHYRQIAKGGVGLIIQEATCVNKEGRLSPTQLGIWDDKHIEGLHRITEAVHEENCRIFVQIHHAGIVGISDEPLCPSPYVLKDRNGQQKTGKEMTLQDIHDIQCDFVAAGKRAYLAGYDGVELHGCHSYLISQFLNHKVNRRQDDYGMDSTRFVTEIVDGIRKVTSDEFVVGIRLGGFEPTLFDSIRNATILEKNGIDFLNISYGFREETEPYAPVGYPCKDIIYAAGEIKKRVSVPVFAVNGIRTPEDANGVLAAVAVDMVDIGRSMLVDSNWANKALAGEEPGKCLDCAKCAWWEDQNKCAGRRLLAYFSESGL